MPKIKIRLAVVKGYEWIANILEVMPDDRHCNSYALGKSRMPPVPTGKTVRLKPVSQNFKLYID